jgi:drug/metabolite transporter (DMT)-like permease
MLEVDGFWMVFSVGCFGGILTETVKWFRIRESPNFPYYAKSPLYWILTLIMILCGGILTTFYGISKVNALLAVNIGASAPLIISLLASALPENSSAKQNTRSLTKGEQPSIINFLRGR